MKWFKVKITDLDSGAEKTNIKIPLFVVAAAGKHTPDFIFNHLLSRSGAIESESEFFKKLARVVAEVLKEVAEDESLSKYNGMIAEIEDNGEKVEVSIT